ncbi:hypothetical protein [Polyangium fumosum]|uniref:Uncharacterized protein n=1 Tax=Polyangium fumosum TaxID=889272 RepID=A0A4U1IMR0_9BACT|nr:hypothetical protein [Polyangium fumosum]TKC95258.1 hypothetical protein E8A74_47135 [Polyangium fumosum]
MATSESEIGGLERDRGAAGVDAREAEQRGDVAQDAVGAAPDALELGALHGRKGLDLVEQILDGADEERDQGAELVGALVYWFPS